MCTVCDANKPVFHNFTMLIMKGSYDNVHIFTYAGVHQSM